MESTKESNKAERDFTIAGVGTCNFEEHGHVVEGFVEEHLSKDGKS